VGTADVDFDDSAGEDNGGEISPIAMEGNGYINRYHIIIVLFTSSCPHLHQSVNLLTSATTLTLS